MSRSDGTVSEQFLHSMIEAFRSQKRMAEKAIAQLPDEKLHIPLDANTNSVCVIMKHMAGNLRSRFTDFLTSDGEKPDRDRDGEFSDQHATREQIMAHWEGGWRVLFEALESLRPDDLTKEITIRQEPYGVVDSLHRALAHQGYHVGQIVQLARFLAKDDWTTITIPRGGSQVFNQTMREKHGQ
jgi:uncharacterized damage-inducible protein DinB